MPSLDSSRSTCLVACLVARPRAAARPSPMAETASEALCSTPIVALHRLSTRLACRSCSNTLPSTRCTASNENRLMSATWGLMTCSARFVGCLRGRLVKTRWGESGLAKLQCYCVMAASPILFGNHGGAGDSIIPTLVREQNEGIHKLAPPNLRCGSPPVRGQVESRLLLTLTSHASLDRSVLSLSHCPNDRNRRR